MRLNLQRFGAAAARSGGAAWIAVAILALIAAISAQGFLSVENLSNVTRQGTALAVIALAQFLVVISGEVDLSLASNAKLSSIVAAIVMAGSDGNLVTGLLAGIAVGLTVGMLNAIVVVLLGVESFIATLGIGTIVAGIALFVAPTPSGASSPALAEFYSGSIGGLIYFPVVAVTLLWALTWFVLNRTVTGRHLYATGGAAHSAHLSGVRTRSIGVGTYIVSGVLGSITGVLLLAATGVGDPNAANGMDFTALAIVVVGGASLAGGFGRLTGLLGGVVLFTLLGNVFNLLRVEVWYQQFFRGLIILAAMALFVQVRTRRRRQRSPRRDASPRIPHSTQK